MKTPFITLLLVSLLTSQSLLATESVPNSSPPPAVKEMAALEHFLDLTDEDLDQMQRVITRIRAMTPEEKAALRLEMEKFRELPETQRRKLRQGWGALDEDLQVAWRQMMHAATPERRAEIQAQLRTLPPGKKGAYRQELAEKFLQQESKK
mgnify:CR=1 FL=1